MQSCVCIQFMPMGVVTEALHVGCTGWLPSVTGLCLARDTNVTTLASASAASSTQHFVHWTRLTAYCKLFAVDVLHSH
jgi:hypothetical protein